MTKPPAAAGKPTDVPPRRPQRLGDPYPPILQRVLRKLEDQEAKEATDAETDSAPNATDPVNDTEPASDTAPTPTDQSAASSETTA